MVSGARRMLGAVKASPPFTARERVILREHGIAFFADRVIFDAQPPISAAAMTRVARRCAGPLPTSLVRLWRTTAGGSLDYQLPVHGDGYVETLSWTGLFYEGGDGDLDLHAWIDHELAQRPGRPRGTKVLAVPIGGFEAVERIYVFVGAGPAHGKVFAWSEGPPPAWTKTGPRAGVVPVADDLHGAFAALTLAAPPGPDSAFRDHVAELVAAGLDRRLATKLLAFHRRAAPARTLSRTRLAKHPRLALQTLAAAIKRDDAAAIRRLARDVPLDRPVAGPAIPLTFAVSIGRFAAANALLAAGAPIDALGLTYLHEAAPPALVQALLDRGAEPLISTLVACAREGNLATADLLARAYSARHDDLVAQFAKAHAAALASERADLARCNRGVLLHPAGAPGIERNIANLAAYQLPRPAARSGRRPLRRPRLARRSGRQ